MTISEVIATIDEQNEAATIFVKRIDGWILPHSEAIIVELDEEEQSWITDQIANKYCPGFNYFLEVFIVKDLMDDFKGMVEYATFQQQVERIFHYAEFDA